MYKTTSPKWHFGHFGQRGKKDQKWNLVQKFVIFCSGG
jgi:hypothetical protein